VTHVIALRWVDIKTAPAWRSVLSTASTRVGVAATSTLMCVDCGARESVCPVEAIYYGDDMPEKWVLRAEDKARFFSEPLLGLDAPSGGQGAAKIGAITVQRRWSPHCHHRGEVGRDDE
jgi:ferredoxin